MHKVVIDANVLVSAVFGGIPLKAVDTAFRRGTIFISPSLEKELTGLPEKLRRKLTPEQVLEFRNLLRTLLVLTTTVKPNRRIEICRDRKDNAYLELCLAARADFLITGDRDLLAVPRQDLSASGLGELRIVTPVEFCKLP